MVQLFIHLLSSGRLTLYAGIFPYLNWLVLMDRSILIDEGSMSLIQHVR